MSYPIILFAFDRLDYFEAVLRSLKQQVGATIEGREMHLFQDGASCAWTGELRTTEEAVARSIELFRTHVPHGEVHFDGVNRGIALQWHRGEEFIFGRRGAPAAYMLEDDTVFGPHYLAMVDQLADRARAHGRISYVSAFGDPVATLEEQAAGHRAMLPMNHTWGAVMLRDYWLKERELIRPYYELMTRRPYRDRPHDEILQLLHRSMGGGHGTAQDAAKESASIALGYARLRTKVCQAKYIGDRGAHFTRAVYERYGFDRTVLFPEPVFDIDLPEGEALDRLIAGERQMVQRNMHRQALLWPGLFAVLASRVRVAVGEGRWLLAGEPGTPVAVTGDPADASVVSVLSWEDEPGACIAVKTGSGHWIGLDGARTLAVMPERTNPTYLLRAPGMTERFCLCNHEALAVACEPDAHGRRLRAGVRRYSEAVAFSLVPAP